MKAENFYLQDLRNRPDDITLKYMLGRIYLYEERYAEAKARLMEARKRAASDPDVRRSLSIVLKKLGEDNLALNEFMMSVKLEQAADKQ
jgi:Flp pilus assembly protein TadD